MKAQTILVLLLILCLALGSTARPLFAQEEARDATQITVEEKQEVLEVAERFVRRMQETNDLAPLIGEMFVSDYAERLCQEATDKSLLFMKKNVVRQASWEELARYQIALNTSGYVVGLLIAEYEESHAKTDEGEDREDFANTLPPDILALFKNDSLLTSLFEKEQKAQAGKNKLGGQLIQTDQDGNLYEPIQSIEQLRNLTSTLEQAGILARKHLDALAVKPSHLKRHKGANEEENWEAERDWIRPRAWVLTREFFGYPEGTRIFCANVLIYHMDLVRVDGKLKVLALYPNMD